jgi:asparagine synthase (glutamine-hydrolysing)
MCGILGVFGTATTDIRQSIKTLVPRGPEQTRIVNIVNGVLGFTRLAINGLTEEGMQPFKIDRTVFMVNGEIYNCQALQKEYNMDCLTGSDCEVVGKLVRKYPLKFLGRAFQLLDGVFATIIVDKFRDYIIIARDPFGVRPLFKAVSDGGLVVGSELKSMANVLTVEAVEPGTFEVYDANTLALIEKQRYHHVALIRSPHLGSIDIACMAVRQSLEAAVLKRMMMERPVAALLSGGLDSSLMAALVQRELKKVGKRLKTFSIGMKGSSDLFHAAKVAAWIDSDHTEVILGPDDFFGAVEPVIHAIESYDTTTVRASVGNWLVAREVAKTDCKVVFNGDGSDEVWGSYLYFYGAPSDHEYEEEVLRLLADIHTFDVLRSDRSIASHGLEPRTPYLDKTFVQTVLSLPLEFRRPSRTRCEKWLMRRAFDDGLLPREVLWRRKEAFSDGVSGEKAWYQIAQEKAEELKVEVINTDCVNPPLTAEMAYYRSVFNKWYSNFPTATVPYFWMPRWTNATDPSARTLAIYNEGV